MHEASSDCDVARARWQKLRNANIGVATGARSNLWVLDIDPDHGGNESLAVLVAEHGELPDTVRVHRPSGGFHLWWEWPGDGRIIRNSTGRIGPGIDARGEGGYIVAPPSRLRDGCGYRWRRGPTKILPAPDWLIELAIPPVPETPPQPKPLDGKVENYVAAAIADELRELSRAGEGTRNDSLNKAAFALAGFVKSGHVPHDWTIATLKATAVDIGLPLREAEATIQSAFRAAQPREVS